MIRVQNLAKTYGPKVALSDLDLTVETGTFLGVLGRNGAGKTTLVRALTGQLRPTSGTIHILGRDLAARPLDLRRRMGVMPEPTALLEDLTGAQYLQFTGQLRGLAFTEIQRRARELGDLLETDFGRSEPIAAYSFGMKKKVAFASAILHGPELLFLDEPFEGLDPVSADTLRELLVRLHAAGTTLVMTSHLLGMAERLCTRFVIIDQGRKVAEGTPGELLQGPETLEDLFLKLMGGRKVGALSWI